MDRKLQRKLQFFMFALGLLTSLQTPVYASSQAIQQETLVSTPADEIYQQPQGQTIPDGAIFGKTEEERETETCINRRGCGRRNRT